MPDDRERWGQRAHEARMAYEEATGRPFSLPWQGRARTAREEDMAIGSAVAAVAARDERERIAAALEALAQAAQDAAQGYLRDPGPPTPGEARADMGGRASAYWKAAQVARGVTGGEGWGEP